MTTTVLGTVVRPLPRGGARPGEQLWLVGEVGLAAAGLAALRLRGARDRGELASCVQAWRRPRALLARGRELAQLASSAIDVSDGLASDARQLARASGVRLVVSRQQLRAALAPALLSGSRALRRSPLAFALYGGEDYALLATGPSARRRCSRSSFTSSTANGRSRSSGVWSVSRAGITSPWSCPRCRAGGRPGGAGSKASWRASPVASSRSSPT